MASGASWLDRWFVEIMPWEPGVVDDERVAWIRVFGVPCHLWNDEFFRFISIPFGSFIDADEITKCQAKFDMARSMIRTLCASIIN